MAEPSPKMASAAIVPFNFTAFITFECEYYGSEVTSKGVFRNENPLLVPLPFTMFSVGVTILLLAIIKQLLKPFRQPRFVAEMLTGILLGPSLFKLIGKEDFYASLFDKKQTAILNALELVSFAVYSFIVGVRTDLTLVKAAGKLSWIIGILLFVLPMVAVTSACKWMINTPPPPFDGLYKWTGTLAAATSFQVTTYLLEDLKLLNSEIGRLALSSSLISGLCFWIYNVVDNFITFAKLMSFSILKATVEELSKISFVLVIVFVIRPFLYSLMRKIPEGKSMKEKHFFIIMTIFLSVACASECLGYKAHFGAMVLGFVVPSGQPIGSGLVEKLELFISGLLLPIYIFNAGRYVNIFNITLQNFGIVEMLIFIAFMMKFATSLIPWLFVKMPAIDSLTLGLILSSQGFFDILSFKLYLNYMMISEELYTILTIMTVFNAAIVTPVISYIYDPSKRYMNYKRRTIHQSNAARTELRVSVCVQEEDHVLSLMNILRGFYPTRERPIGVFVIDLKELVGRDHPLLINHQFHHRRSSHTRINRIINAFSQLEQQHEGTIRHQFFTSITPYSSMHEDILTLTLERNASLLIIPFQKSGSYAMRGVTKNVLDKAPCSVGLLVDKKIIMHWRSDPRRQANTLRICVIFVGGADFREALACGMFMARNPLVKLHVIRLIAEDEFISDLMDSKLDFRAIAELRTLFEHNQNVDYTEMNVEDGIETSRALLSLGDNYDFILTGRRIEDGSPLVKGLSDWSYVEELGIIGDIIASSDMKSNASVLVIQQQSTREDQNKY
ncbi:hypothetical protein NMG60_11031899 [Bertholletia excelsa]